MMAPLAIIITTLLVQSTWGYSVDDQLFDGNYESPSSSYYLYSDSDEIPEDNDNELSPRQQRNSNFMRFGRSGGGSAGNGKKDIEYAEDDYAEDFARPTRSGKIDKNDYFIRFGRSKQDFLRFGRFLPYRVQRDRNSNHLRFGRSARALVEAVEDDGVENGKKRSKRDTTYSEFKRGNGGSNFMRFGRNSNFMRFGRNNNGMPTASVELENHMPEEIMEKPSSPLIQLLSELVRYIRNQEQKKQKCTAAS